jgi:hypothetical protein
LAIEDVGRPAQRVSQLDDPPAVGDQFAVAVHLSHEGEQPAFPDAIGVLRLGPEAGSGVKAQPFASVPPDIDHPREGRIHARLDHGHDVVVVRGEHTTGT